MRIKTNGRRSEKARGTRAELGAAQEPAVKRRVYLLLAALCLVNLGFLIASSETRVASSELPRRDGSPSLLAMGLPPSHQDQSGPVISHDIKHDTSVPL